MSDELPAYRVYVCQNVQCVQRDARKIWAVLNAEVAAHGLAERVELIVSGCQSRCDYGPNINVYPKLTKYAEVTPELARKIVQEHLAGGTPVADAIFDDMYR